MKISTRQFVIEDFFDECMDILASKGADYSGEEDGLANFKRNAERLGLSKYQVWLVYFMKHIDSISNSIKGTPNDPQVESEPLSERCKDGVNYLALLHCMLLEDAEYEEGKDDTEPPFSINDFQPSGFTYNAESMKPLSIIDFQFNGFMGDVTHSLVPGNLAMIARKPSEEELTDWNNSWVESMDREIGKVMTMKYITNDSIEFHESSFTFPLISVSPVSSLERGCKNCGDD